ncbi:leucine-rich repeat protein [Ruminococcus flavefaciens]|uniref:leucine-rich repeat protein n=1 Tax=Ruminococcus flavefaciens TaxID=1265 RepID=UPI00048D1882|nr:leucine-rich repeat protein [Ruminococcus flavefaciens]
MKTMMNKKIAAIFTAIAALFCSVPVRANAELMTENDVVYDVDDESGTCSVAKYNGNASIVEIPAALGRYKVVSIADEAFRGNPDIKYVTLPSTISKIDESAFSECKNLKSINFPSSLESIGGYAFNTNHSLDGIKLNSGLRKIKNDTFQLCISVKALTIPPLVETICDHALHGMHSMETLRFCEGVKKIEKTAALNSYKISRIIIPPSVEEIQEYAVGYRYYSPDYNLCSNVEIYGKKGTEAERYAKDNDIPFNEFDFRYGDVNSDGKVDSVDASAVLAEYSRRSTEDGKSKFSKTDDVKADVNDDLIVDAVDASLILSYYSHASSGDMRTPEEYFFLA